MENNDQKTVETDPLDEMESQIEQNNEALEGEVLTDKEKATEDKSRDEAALLGATMAVSFAETLLKMKWEYVEVQPEVKSQLVEKAAPVVKKYDGDLPAWLAPYKEEIELGIVVAVAGFGIAMQVKAHHDQQSKDSQQVNINESDLHAAES